ncbi:hypothetical protein ACJU26_15445 [Acidithiobacillus sp. M4-SHS-6]|uniref:hypothetical protein n=1 Tax=Acidithiobacillus sp. M4-SHS-6 TaxID=3383024 RepID=UPI0039BEB204
MSRHLLTGSLAMACAIALGAPGLSQAATPDHSLIPSNRVLERDLGGTKISGMIGLINFSYLNHAHTTQDTHSFALGGHLYLHSPSFYGLSLGVGGDFATWTDFYQHEDPELTGPYPSHGIAILRLGYLQYHHGPVVIRGGREFINTPYANMDYYTFNPRAFTGVAAVWDILGHPKGETWAGNGPLTLSGSPATVSLFFAREFAYASRFSPTFTRGNRYTNGAHTNGFYTIGLRFRHQLWQGSHVAAQLWDYNFYGFANMFYGQANLFAGIGPHLGVIGGFQMISEGNSGTGTNFLQDFLRSHSVDAHLYGVRLGVQFGREKDSVALVGNYNPVNYDSFRHGGLIHPYNDLTGTLYTTTMQTGLSDMGPGYAYGIASNFGFLNHRLLLNASFIRYVAKYGYGGSTYTYGGAYGFPAGVKAVPNQKMWSMDVGFSYNLSQFVRGLTVADYTDISVTQNRTGYPQYQNPYFSNRFYLKYHF